MPDRLYQAIEGAIGLELDGRVFERCAVDLLRKAYYADLRGTPHERDAGMDGISGPDSDPEFILIATTSNDFARNLRSSVKRYVGAGGRGDGERVAVGVVAGPTPRSFEVRGRTKGEHAGGRDLEKGRVRPAQGVPRDASGQDL